MSVFGNHDKDELEEAIRIFLEDHTISELMNIVSFCIDEKEQYLISKLKGENK